MSKNIEHRLIFEQNYLKSIRLYTVFIKKKCLNFKVNYYNYCQRVKTCSLLLVVFSQISRLVHVRKL